MHTSLCHKWLKGIFYSGLFVIGIELAGCVTTISTNVANAPITMDQQMAKATAMQLKTLYPPAKTQLILSNPGDDYGAALERALRLQGYAVFSDNSDNASAAPTSAIPLQYNLDVVGDFYRVTMQAGNQTLSCLFQPGTDGKLYAAGPWVRGEA
jgi:hypothetical protein